MNQGHIFGQIFSLYDFICLFLAYLDLDLIHTSRAVGTNHIGLGLRLDNVVYIHISSPKGSLL